MEDLGNDNEIWIPGLKNSHKQNILDPMQRVVMFGYC
jgi:hypothetical protein